MNSLKYNKHLDVLAEYDVIVCGGGTAGFCAALAAARGGAKTAVVEQYGSLGGTITNGGNPHIGLFYAGDTQVVAGIGWETVNRLAEEGFARIPKFARDIRHSLLNVEVDGPMFGHLLDRMCAEAGVDVYLHHALADMLVIDDRVTHAVVCTKTGLKAIRGKVFIDCTGDGDAAFFSGAAYELGDADNGQLQPGTLRFYLRGFCEEELQPDQLRQAFAEALDRGEVLPSDSWSGNNPMGIFGSNGNNINHIVLNGADSTSRSQGEAAGRASVARIIRWARKYAKGAENVSVVALGNEVCCRESRRIVCDGTVTVEDYCSGRVYDDAVCYSYYPIDLHADGKKTLHNIFIDQDTHPTIPLSAMMVSGLSNMLVAGRCISGDRLANSAFRVKASCMAMGEAAGTAAALCVEANQALRALPLETLRDRLRQNGAIVPQP